MDNSKRPLLRDVDHITYCVRPDSIEAWYRYHTEVEGGRPGPKINDVKPDDPRSSMMLWTINFDSFGVALVAGIDRSEKSQATSFVERHGDHSIQHVAYQVDDLETFVEHMRRNGVEMRGEVLVRQDERGLVKQVFARGFEEGDAGEVAFSEFVERITDADETTDIFSKSSQDAGKGFYDQVEDARRVGDQRPMVDISRLKK